MTIGLIILSCLAATFLGAVCGLILSIHYYPAWQVRKVRRHLQKDGIQYGEWNHVYEFVDHHVKVIVKPNCETLYSLSFIHRDDGPYVIRMPSFRNYFSFAFLDRNADVIGYFTNDDVEEDKSTDFLVYYNDDQSKGVQLPSLKLDSKICWIIGRFGVNNEEEIPAINKLQDDIQLIKLKEYQYDQAETG